MASNKKTTEPIFSNATEMMWFQDRNCQYCAKYTQYNEKLGKFPQFRCAVQRDMELQAVGIEEVSQRSYDACQSGTCPFLKRKDGDVEVKHKEIGKHTAPKAEPKVAIKAEAPINILEQAEKMRQERIAKAEQEERNKTLDNALEAMQTRRLRNTLEMGIYPRERGEHIPAKVYVNKKPKKERTGIPQEVRQYYEELSIKMKDECNDILTHHLGLLNLICRAILDVADSQMQDVIRELKKRKMYRFALKRDINIVQANYDKMYNMIVKETRDIDDFFTRVLDETNDAVEGDITKFYYAIKNGLDKYKVEDSGLKARMELIGVMFRFCAREKDVIKDRCRTEVAQVFRRENLTIPSNFSEQLNYCFDIKDPNPISKAWEKASAHICTYSSEIDKAVCDSQDFKNGLRILISKFTNVDLLNSINNKILQEEPETLESFFEFHPDADRTKIVI